MAMGKIENDAGHIQNIKNLYSQIFILVELSSEILSWIKTLLLSFGTPLFIGEINFQK